MFIFYILRWCLLLLIVKSPSHIPGYKTIKMVTRNVTAATNVSYHSNIYSGWKKIDLFNKHFSQISHVQFPRMVQCTPQKASTPFLIGYPCMSVWPECLNCKCKCIPPRHLNTKTASSSPSATDMLCLGCTWRTPGAPWRMVLDGGLSSKINLSLTSSASRPHHLTQCSCRKHKHHARVAM